MSETKKTPTPRILVIFAFVGVLSVFLYLANLIVYEALADIFSLEASWQLILLGTSLGVLSGGFVLSTILGMRYYNVFTRVSYLISAVWIGLFVYLFLVSVLYGLLVMIFGVSLNIIGEILILCAIVVSIYGVIHGRNVYVTEFQISLPNLPDKWRGRKAVWISDFHLGQLRGKSFAKKVAEKVNSLPHDIIFIGGDLYDGTGAPDLNEIISPLKSLSAPLGIYFITGNHEEFGDSSAFLSAVKAANIRPLIDEMVEIDGLQLIGVDYHNASNKEAFRKILSSLKIQIEKPSILLKHEPKDLDIAREAGISFQISGHTHRAQMWPLQYVARLAYKGFVYGLKQFGNMQVYISSGVGTWGPPLRVGTDAEIVSISFV